MSYILEALKKSELERGQLEASAETEVVLETVPQAAKPHSFKSMLKQGSINTYLLLMVIAVLVYISFSKVNVSKEDSRLPEQSISEAAATDDISQSLNDAVSEHSQLALQVKEPPKHISVAPVLAAKPAGEIANEVIATKEITQDTIAETSHVVISIEQGGEQALAKIPNISITSHIYSSQANRRSIVVNDERLIEGDFVSPQVQIYEITHQGMILKVNDSLLAVSRSRGWKR